jgi:uncharacterized membrane protein
MHQTRFDVASQQWMLKRNCCLSPRQLAAYFVALSSISLAIAVLFALQGAWPIIVFAGVEALGLSIAFFAYGRHAGDYERIEVGPAKVTVETMDANRVQRRQLTLSWLRVEYRGGASELVRLVSGRQSLAVGRFMPDNQRKRLATELRATIAAANAEPRRIE